MPWTLGRVGSAIGETRYDARRPSTVARRGFLMSDFLVSHVEIHYSAQERSANLIAEMRSCGIIIAVRWSEIAMDFRLTQVPQRICKPSGTLSIDVKLGSLGLGWLVFPPFSGGRLFTPIGTMDCVQISGFQIIWIADHPGRLKEQRTQVTN